MRCNKNYGGEAHLHGRIMMRRGGCGTVFACVRLRRRGEWTPMNNDQIIGWLIVAGAINGLAWACVLAHLNNLRNQLSREQLVSAHLRERLEPMYVFGQSEQQSSVK